MFKKNQTLVDLIAETLKKHAPKRLTARSLAEVIVSDYPDWVRKKREKSKNPAIRDGEKPEITLQIQSEIGSKKQAIERHPDLRMTEDRPRLYYYSSISDEDEVSAAESEAGGSTFMGFKEHDLYPRLSAYLAEEHRVYSKRIDEKRSGNKSGPRGNHWLFPDLIGFEPLSGNWSETIKKLVSARSDPEVRLWSFEVKKLVNRSNVREVFFQALSNSAWANLGYLVAAEISGQGTLDELRMLSQQHGIGVIQLSATDETESTILIQAQMRPAVDWQAADRLSDVNRDAESVFNQVRVYHQSGELNVDFWDTNST